METRHGDWDIRRKDYELLATLATRHKSLLAFLETYTLDPISRTQAQRLEGEDAVTLITVHSAKGTEAPVCYVIRAEPGMYPNVRSLGKQDEEEEDRRVLYVAMARAQNELILTRSLSHRGAVALPGGFAATHSEDGTSYFLEGVPDDLVNLELRGFAAMNGADGLGVSALDDEIIVPVRR